MGETRPYRPSNGTEGEMFQAAFCENCERDRYESKPCRILSRSMAYNLGDKNYPKEWVQDATGWPGNSRCTAFVERGTVTRPVLSTIHDKRQIGLPL